jgi:hypothetical protein
MNDRSERDMKGSAISSSSETEGKCKNRNIKQRLEMGKTDR